MPDALPYLIIAAWFGLVLALPTIMTRWVPALWHRYRLRGRAAWAAERGLLAMEPVDAAGRIDDADRPGIFRELETGRVLDAFQNHDVVVMDYAYVRPKPPGSRVVPSLEATSLVLARTGLLLPVVQVQPWQTKPPPPQVIARLIRPGAMFSGLMKQVFATTHTGDAAFDPVFRVIGNDESAINGVLTPRVRALMLRAPRMTFALGPRGVLVRGRDILPASEFDELIRVTRELVGALNAEQRSA